MLMESYERPAGAGRLERFSLGFIAAFITLFALTTALPHAWLPLPAEFVSTPFDGLAALTATRLLGAPPGDRSESDSTGMIAHAVNLLLLSLACAQPIAISLRQSRVRRTVETWLPRLAAYLLAWQLLQYGFNKVFKWQFYRPEPNIQYSRIVDLSPDMLYWTTMGVSRGYSIFLGAIELLAAALLLFHRTRLAGALLAAGILANVLAVNFAFDVTVRLLSSFLLLLALIVIWERRRSVLAIFGVWGALPVRRETLRRSWIAKGAVIMVIVADAGYPYLRSGNFNDDADARPALHGAYAVVTNATTPRGPAEVFIHRQGYLIFRNREGQFRDFLITTDTAARIIWASNAQDSLEWGLDYELAGGTLHRLHGHIAGDSLDLRLRPLPLRY